MKATVKILLDVTSVSWKRSASITELAEMIGYIAVRS